MTDPADQYPLSAAELARRYGVDRSTVSHALKTARAAHAKDAANPAPPAPVVTGPGGRGRYLPSEFDPWWAQRQPTGRPRKAQDASTDGD
ncbi:MULTISPECIES: hypothetical protein [Streptacidiphilus]|uniref:HTH domain-containing protein n=1 Tax=Streptacidiphilus cavernicola TaxID=3342716 RepID=A0ABV6UW59_9ACTN|nr:hypothetical protein [Streptacidiphilus jeojiense]